MVMLNPWSDSAYRHHSTRSPLYKGFFYFKCAKNVPLFHIDKKAPHGAQNQWKREIIFMPFQKVEILSRLIKDTIPSAPVIPDAAATIAFEGAYFLWKAISSDCPR